MPLNGLERRKRISNKNRKSIRRMRKRAGLRLAKYRVERGLNQTRNTMRQGFGEAKGHAANSRNPHSYLTDENEDNEIYSNPSAEIVVKQEIPDFDEYETNDTDFSCSNGVEVATVVKKEEIDDFDECNDLNDDCTTSEAGGTIKEEPDDDWSNPVD